MEVASSFKTFWVNAGWDHCLGFELSTTYCRAAFEPIEPSEGPAQDKSATFDFHHPATCHNLTIGS